MREIKFRAWCESLKLMQAPFDLIKDKGMLGGLGEIHNADYIVMQYTGLKDRSGVEIYEGDILRFHDPDDFDHEEPHLTDISWHEEQGCWMTDDIERTLGDVLLWYNEVEVIGNIHENPELLDKKG